MSSPELLMMIRMGAAVYDTIHGPVLRTGKQGPLWEERIDPRVTRTLQRKGLIEVHLVREYGRQRRRFRTVEPT